MRLFNHFGMNSAASVLSEAAYSMKTEEGVEQANYMKLCRR